MQTEDVSHNARKLKRNNRNKIVLQSVNATCNHLYTTNHWPRCVNRKKKPTGQQNQMGNVAYGTDADIMTERVHPYSMYAFRGMGEWILEILRM